MAAAIAASVVAGAAKARGPASTSEPNTVAAANTRADLMNIVHTPNVVAIAETLLPDMTDFWLLPGDGGDGYVLCGEAIHRLSHILQNVYRQAHTHGNNPADVVPDSTHVHNFKSSPARFPRSGKIRLHWWRLTLTGNRVDSRYWSARADGGRSLLIGTCYWLESFATQRHPLPADAN